MSDLKLCYRAIVKNNNNKKSVILAQKQTSRQELSVKDSDSIRHVPRIDKCYSTIKTRLHHKENSLHSEEIAYRKEEKSLPTIRQTRNQYLEYSTNCEKQISKLQII